TEVWSLTRTAALDSFVATTTAGLRYRARFVIIAIGKMGRPRQPDYYKTIPPILKNEKRILFDINARSFDGAKLLVVGAGARAAYYPQRRVNKSEVACSYRKKMFSRLNSINEKIMAGMIAERKIRTLMPSNIIKIENDNGRPIVEFAEGRYPPEVFDAVLYGL